MNPKKRKGIEKSESSRQIRVIDFINRPLETTKNQILKTNLFH